MNEWLKDKFYLVFPQAKPENRRGIVKSYDIDPVDPDIRIITVERQPEPDAQEKLPKEVILYGIRENLRGKGIRRGAEVVWNLLGQLSLIPKRPKRQ